MSSNDCAGYNHSRHKSEFPLRKHPGLNLVPHRLILHCHSTYVSWRFRTHQTQPTNLLSAGALQVAHQHHCHCHLPQQSRQKITWLSSTSSFSISWEVPTITRAAHQERRAALLCARVRLLTAAWLIATWVSPSEVRSLDVTSIARAIYPRHKEEWRGTSRATSDERLLIAILCKFCFGAFFSKFCQ